MNTYNKKNNPIIIPTKTIVTVFSIYLEILGAIEFKSLTSMLLLIRLFWTAAV